jgi:hypothetical protein
MPREYVTDPQIGPTGPCRVCGNVRTLKLDGTLRVHGAPGKRGMNCHGSGQAPRGLGDQRPVWLLDVDGVLNAHKPGWGAAPTKHDVWSSVMSRSFTIRFAPSLLRRIREIHRAGRVEIRWCTTWCGDTAALEKALALPAFAQCWTEYRNGRAGSEAKLAAARAVLAEGRRLVWTDDNEVPPESWPLHAELARDGRALLIRPDERYGLQPDHLDAIEAYVGNSTKDGTDA